MRPRGYDYAPAHRALEIAGIATLWSYLGLLAWDGLGALAGPARAQAWWVLTLVPLAAVLAADFVSGGVHFLADRFGTVRTPLLGPNFVRPFREHHVDPEGITRHDFIETNGNNSIVSVPVAMGCYHALPRDTPWLAAPIAIGVGSFLIGIFLTNQLHKWAHTASPPAWVAYLQRRWVILPGPHHRIHHTPPFDTYYCITTGWLNPLLHRLGFFARVERAIRLVLGRMAGPRPEEQEPVALQPLQLPDRP